MGNRAQSRIPGEVFSAVTCPPWFSTMALTIASPNPLPGQAVAVRPRKTGQTVAYLRIFSGRLTRKLPVRAEHARDGE
jgi:hypothetical protein